MLGIGGNRRRRHIDLGGHDLAVVAARHDTFAVARRRQDAAAVNHDALRIAVPRYKQQRFVAKHEYGGVGEKIRPDHGRSRRDRPRAIGDGGPVSGSHGEGLSWCNVSQYRHGRARPGHPRLRAREAAKSWMPGTRPGMTHRNRRASRSRRAFLEALADHALRQFAADEYDAAFALFAVAPVALMITIEHHVDALEGKALGVVLERQDAFGAENILTLLSHQILDPRKELVRIERLVGFERQRLHILVVIMLEPAMIMVVAIGMIVVMMIVTVVRLQELWLDIEDAVEVEGVAVQHLGERHRTALRQVERRIWINGADARFDLPQVRGADEVRLVDKDHVGERDLILGLWRIAQPVLEPFGISDRDDGVELRLAADLRVHEKGLGDRRRVGKPRGLDDDGVEFAFAPHQALDDTNEIAAHRAADAAVVHLEDFLVGVDDQVIVDADLAELVDDDRVFLPMRLRQNAVEQRRLAGPEIAGQDRDGDFVGGDRVGKTTLQSSAPNIEIFRATQNRRLAAFGADQRGMR